MINVSVVGVGYWGPNLIRNFIHNSFTNIEVVCDLSRDRLNRIKKIYPSLQTVQDYREIINSNYVDLIAICTPVNTHFELAKKALENGKHVLLTKPFTSTSEQAEYLINLAQKRNRKLFVDHTFLFHGAVRKIKDFIETDEIGELFYFDSVRVNLGLFQHDVNVIWDLAPHDISIMHYLLDKKPEGVAAVGAAHYKSGLEDVAYLTIYYPDNLIAHIHINWLSPVKIRQTLIAGSKKMIMWDDNEPIEKVRIYDKGVSIIKNKDEVYNMLIQYRMGDMYCPTIETNEALGIEIDHIVDCIENGTRSISDGNMGLIVVKILEAAQRSMKERGREVKIN